MLWAKLVFTSTYRFFMDSSNNHAKNDTFLQHYTLVFFLCVSALYPRGQVGVVFYWLHQ